mmetsp:Transcript_19062/g.38766  ORF Transcript_19062/g.38766 Transcript_19062/m.38766 type:complete len:266 (-) Transcript_19062:140-937(-)
MPSSSMICSRPAPCCTSCRVLALSPSLHTCACVRATAGELLGRRRRAAGRSPCPGLCPPSSCCSPSRSRRVLTVWRKAAASCRVRASSLTSPRLLAKALSRSSSREQARFSNQSLCSLQKVSISSTCSRVGVAINDSLSLAGGVSSNPFSVRSTARVSSWDTSSTFSRIGVCIKFSLYSLLIAGGVSLHLPPSVCANSTTHVSSWDTSSNSSQRFRVRFAELQQRERVDPESLGDRVGGRSSVVGGCVARIIWDKRENRHSAKVV